MSDKLLLVAEWKKFAKGQDIKDSALLKALEALDKAARSGPDVLLKVLDEVSKQITLLLKSAKGDKALTTYLASMEKALVNEQKLAQQAIKDAAKAAQSEEDDEEESPALLTTMMVPLIKQLRPGGVVMPVMVALGGKETVLLISKRAISPARRKQLAQTLGMTSGIKYIVGECLFEEGFLTFVVQSAAAGLAKRLKAALLHQTGLRLKVRVRGEGQEDVDEDAADAEQAGPNDAQATAQTQQPTSAKPGAITAEQLTAAMNKLAPKIKALMAQSPATKAPLLALVTAFQTQLKAGQVDAAGAELKRVAALLAAPDTSVFDRAMAAWSQARVAVLGQLLALEKAIRGMQDPEGDAAIILVKAIQANITAKPSTPQAVAELARYITTDDIIDEAEGPNGFGLTVQIRQPLLAALTQLRGALPA